MAAEDPEFSFQSVLEPGPRVALYSITEELGSSLLTFAEREGPPLSFPSCESCAAKICKTRAVMWPALSASAAGDLGL